MTHESFRELAPLYVIGALDGAELIEFERYVATNRPQCEVELKEFQAVADQLAMSVPQAQPSSGVLRRILAVVEKSEKPEPTRTPVAERSQRDGFNWRSLVFGWAPWAAVAVMFVLLTIMTSQMRTMTHRFREQQAEGDRDKEIQARQDEKISQLSSNLDAQSRESKIQVDQLRADNQVLQRDTQALKATNLKLAADKIELMRVADDLRKQAALQDAQMISLQRQVGDQSAKLEELGSRAIRLVQLSDPKGETKAAASVYWQDAKKQGQIVVSSLQPVVEGQGKALELWAICGSEPPVPAGLFWTDAAGHGEMEIRLSGEMACLDKFAVSVEPAGGSTSPTGPIVLAGQ